MLRDIISIDEDKCDGCALCIPGCPEGALQIIDGKARLVSDLSCDGLGACIGDCPTGALVIEKRDVPPYDERVVMANIVTKGEKTILAHLRHLKDHNEMEFFNQALDYLQEMGADNPLKFGLNTPESIKDEPKEHVGCPGSKQMEINRPDTDNKQTGDIEMNSELTQWPVQLHLVKPSAPFFKKKDLLLAADCVAFAVGNFHKEYLKDKGLAIACPKLDNSQEEYVTKLVDIIDTAETNTLTVMIMEVPCCSGLLKTAQLATQRAARKIPLKVVTVARDGKINSENWI
ncbi:MAG: 4Fe-4S binding protein [Spirochaetaceae bacterium]